MKRTKIVCLKSPMGLKGFIKPHPKNRNVGMFRQKYKVTFFFLILTARKKYYFKCLLFYGLCVWLTMYCSVTLYSWWCKLIYPAQDTNHCNHIFSEMEWWHSVCNFLVTFYGLELLFVKVLSSRMVVLDYYFFCLFSLKWRCCYMRNNLVCYQLVCVTCWSSVHICTGSVDSFQNLTMVMQKIYHLSLNVWTNV